MSDCLLIVLLAGLLLACAQDPAHQQCERRLVPINASVPLATSSPETFALPKAKSDSDAMDGSLHRK